MNADFDANTMEDGWVLIDEFYYFLFVAQFIPKQFILKFSISVYTEK